MKKIVWVADYTTKEHQGGAQQTNKTMIDYGRKHGFKVKVMLCKDLMEQRSDLNVPLGKADLVILNNIAGLPDNIVNWIIRNCPYMRFEHDYDAVNRIAGIPLLFNKSLLNVFLSPLHLKEARRRLRVYFGYKDLPRAKIVPSPVDPKTFNDRGLKRKKNSVLWAGNIVPEKGIDNMLALARRRKDLEFAVYGFKSELSLPNLGNVSLMGEVSFNKMPELYNRHQYLCHLPNWKEPTGRTVMEAYLCGCDLIVNSNVGWMSFGWDWGDYKAIKDEMRNAPKLFWKLVSKAIKDS